MKTYRSIVKSFYMKNEKGIPVKSLYIILLIVLLFILGIAFYSKEISNYIKDSLFLIIYEQYKFQ